MKDTDPLFTIVIPTMNRSDLLPSVIRSVVAQDFSDFEVIISDNSDQMESQRTNQQTISELRSSSAIHYVSPDRWLNMPDHWEFASKKGKGKYVIFLTDRYVLQAGALKVLSDVLERTKGSVDAICWHDKCSFSDDTGQKHYRPFDGSVLDTTGHELLREYLLMKCVEVEGPFTNRLPRLLNSCYCRSSVESIRKQYGRFCYPISPDYTAAFIQALCMNRIVYLDLPLSMAFGSYSNGRKSVVLGVESYFSTLGDDLERIITPLGINSAFETIYEDFLRIKGQVGCSATEFEFDNVGYSCAIAFELQLKESLGSSLDVKAMWRALERFIDSLEKEQRDAARLRIDRMREKGRLKRQIQRFIILLGLEGAARFVANKARALSNKMKGIPTYRSVLEAAGAGDLGSFLKANTTKIRR